MECPVCQWLLCEAGKHNFLEVNQNQVHNWRVHIPVPFEAMPWLRQLVHIRACTIWGCTMVWVISPYTGTIWGCAMGGAVSPYIDTIWDCAVAWVISHWSLIVDARVQSQYQSCGIYSHQSGTRTVFFPPSISDFSYIFPPVLSANSFINHWC